MAECFYLYQWKNAEGLEGFRTETQAGKVPGTVLAADKEGIQVACGQNVLVLHEVQLEGKKRMEVDAFLRGYQLKPGDMFKDSRE